MIAPDRSTRRPERAAVTGLALLLAAVGMPFAAAGQSLLGSAGLGIPTEPLDSRARALGGVGVGLDGWHLIPTDPAASGGLFLPSIAVTFQPSSATLSDGSEAGRTRFPLVAVSYPYGFNVFSFQLGSYLEQEWGVVTEHTINLAGTPVRATDTFEAFGGIGQARFGWGRRLAEPLAVGVAVGTYLGAVDRRFTRELSAAQVGEEVEIFEERGRWRSSGESVTASVIWDPSALLRLGAGLTWSSDLELTPVGETAGSARAYPLPLEYRLGATMGLTSVMSLSLGAWYADWGDTGAALQEGGSRGGSWSYGGGLEWTGMSFRDRGAPVRIGVRDQQLPFHFLGNEASERTYSGGVGFNLADSEEVPIARVEFGIERGDRSAGPFAETFWRTSLSIRLAGG